VIALLISAPVLALTGLHTKVHVHEDPATSSWALLAQSLLWHEVIGRLHTNADIFLVRAVGQVNFLPELRALGIIFCGVELLDANLVHVLLTVLGCIGRQRAKRLRQEVDDGQLQLWEEVLQLGDPFDSDEASSNDEDGGTLVIQGLDGTVLLKDVATATL